MGLIREPLDVDFFVDPKPLTKKEQDLISEYIRKYKKKHAKNDKRSVRKIKNRRSEIDVKKKKELDVDFIQSKPLTKEEERKLSEFIKKRKAKKGKKTQRRAA